MTHTPPCQVAHARWATLLARHTRKALDVVRVEVDPTDDRVTVWALAVDGTIYRPYERHDQDVVDYIARDPGTNGARWLSEIVGCSCLWQAPSVWRPWRGSRPRSLPGRTHSRRTK